MFNKQKIYPITLTILFVFFVIYGIETFSPSPEYDCYNNQGYDLRNESFEEIKKCEDTYYMKMQTQDKIFFLTTVVIGLVTLILMNYVNIKEIKSGMGLSGTILIFIGTLSYWDYANELLKFIILGAALTCLIIYIIKKSK